ncbi:ethylbenzene dehydrogenase-related protein [Dongia deserti]|uniref:ethylbenzene dehydrogenase-related protein n=1 Tax=Dongia deserti TaxID=2268030 RepID=UPI000E65AC3D|nr:ethylbenzene dehydrogenase-related protein [Dongia deserti]
MVDGVATKNSLHRHTSTLRARSDAPTALLHGALIISLVISLLTGFQIASDAIDSTWARALDALWLQGSVSHWHVWAAYALSLIAVAYVMFLIRARLQARIAVDAARLKAIANADRRARWQAVNVVLYWMAFVLIGVAATTGTLLYLDSALLAHDLVTTIHRAAAWGIVLYAVAHIALQLVMGGVRQLLKILTPRLTYVAAGGIALATGAGGAAALVALDRSTPQTLKLVRVETAPTIDGQVADDAWKALEAVEVHTVRGINFPNGEADVRVRAVHDGLYAYFLFEWPDTTRSQKHLPLVKTAEGWKVLERRYGIQDENDYYEDKFGVMLSGSPEIAGGGSSHLGKQPLAGKPGPAHERGLHFTSDSSIVDVWHWKSVRTGPLGQLDDNYFGPAMEPEEGKRYTGGYTQDPKTAGGFIQNWEKLGNGLVQPLHLPKEPAQIADLQKGDLEPGVSDLGRWFMNLSDTVPYSQEADTYPVGTVLPSVVTEKPFEGDRGDVRGIGTWRDGWWHLEVVRRLDTGSKFDKAITSETYLWVVAFDHAQTRHTQHLHPLTLELE